MSLSVSSRTLTPHLNNKLPNTNLHLDTQDAVHTDAIAIYEELPHTLQVTIPSKLRETKTTLDMQVQLGFLTLILIFQS